MTVSVLQIRDKNAFLVKAGTLDSYLNFLINGELISNELKKQDLVINSDDEFTYLTKNRQLVEYRRGNEIMSIKEYDSKPQYYDSGDSDEYTLRAIANKQELSGFEPHFKEPRPEKIELKIDGFVDDTKSKFIACSVTNKFHSNAILYVLFGNMVTIDEYNLLKEEYKDHAKFNNEGRNYLRFAKINHSYAFTDSYPFNDTEYKKVFLTLEEAQKEEQNIRNLVKERVVKAVFKENLTLNKNLQVLSQLKLIYKLNDIKSIKDALNIMIGDLEEYTNNISK